MNIRQGDVNKSQHLVGGLRFRTETVHDSFLYSPYFCSKNSWEKPILVCHMSSETSKLPKHADDATLVKYDFRIK